MKNQKRADNNNNDNNNPSHNGFIPISFRFISSCIKTASSGVRSARASVAASITGDSQTNKDQVRSYFYFLRKKWRSIIYFFVGFSFTFHYWTVIFELEF